MRSEDGDGADALGIRGENGVLLSGSGGGGGVGAGGNPYRVPRSDPWSPNSVGISLTMPSPELDGRPVTPGTPVPEQMLHPGVDGNQVTRTETSDGVGEMSTVRYVLETVGLGTGTGAVSHSGAGGGGVGSGSGVVSPGMVSPLTGSGSGGESRVVSELGTGSSEGPGGMSARGSWRGWMSPEVAMAGGWKDETVDKGIGSH